MASGRHDHFRRSIDDALRSAENTLSGKGGYDGRGLSAAAAYTPAAAYADPHGYGSVPRHAAVGTVALRDDVFVPLDEVPLASAEMTRQLRVCMTEIMNLRTELSNERESRGELVQQQLRRVRDELAVEMKQAELQMARGVRELEATFALRLQEMEAARAADHRRMDDVARMAKVHERSGFDHTEQLREVVEELRTRADHAVTTAQGVRAEVLRSAEKLSARLTARLDSEVSRFGELYRQQQQQAAEMRQLVSSEIGTVATQVDGLVDAAWAAHMKATARRIDDQIEAFQNVARRSDQQLVELTERVSRLSRDAKHDLQSSTQELQNRVMVLESSQPLLAARMDRAERKADASAEASGRLSAHIDVLKEAADTAAIRGQRAVERAQKVEDTMAERDQRITVLESQTAAVAGVERWRQELEAVRRTVLRVEGQVDTVRTLADKGERAVLAIQRAVDEATERSTEAEKRVNRVTLRLDTVESKSSAVQERLATVEADAAGNAVRLTAVEDTADVAGQRTAAIDSRQKLTADKVEASQRDAFARLAAAEARAEAVGDVAAGIEATLVALRKELDRVDRRAQKAEAAALNAADNNRETRDLLDATATDVSAVKRRAEAAAAREAASTSVANTSLFDSRIDDVAGRAGVLGDRLARVEARLKSIGDDLNGSVDSRVGSLRDELTALARTVREVQTRPVPAPIAAGPGSSAPPIDTSLFASRESQLVLQEQVRGLQTRCGALQEGLHDAREAQQTAARLTDNTVRGLQHSVESLGHDLEAVRRSVADARMHMSELSPLSVPSPQVVVSSTTAAATAAPAQRAVTPLGLPPFTPPPAPASVPALAVEASPGVGAAVGGSRPPSAMVSPRSQMTDWSQVKRTPYSESESEADPPKATVGGLGIGASPASAPRGPLPSTTAPSPSRDETSPSPAPSAQPSDHHQQSGLSLLDSFNLASSTQRTGATPASPRADSSGAESTEPAAKESAGRGDSPPTGHGHDGVTGARPAAAPSAAKKATIDDFDSDTEAEGPTISQPAAAPLDATTGSLPAPRSHSPTQPPATDAMSSSAQSTPRQQVQQRVVESLTPPQQGRVPSWLDSPEVPRSTGPAPGLSTTSLDKPLDKLAADPARANPFLSATIASDDSPPLGPAGGRPPGQAQGPQGRAQSSSSSSDDDMALPDGGGHSRTKHKHYVSSSEAETRPDRAATAAATSIAGRRAPAAHQVPSMASATVPAKASPATAATTASSTAAKVLKKATINDFDDSEDKDVDIAPASPPSTMASAGSQSFFLAGDQPPSARFAAARGRSGGGNSRLSPTVSGRSRPTSRRTTEVSLSLTSTTSPSTRKRDDDDDDDDDDDTPDDDKLAALLETM